MSRVQRYGEWSNRIFRVGAATMSDAEERQTFAHLAVRALRRAAVEAEKP